MKTSEFVSYVDKNWFATWKNGDNVIDIGGIMKVHTNCQLIEFDKKTATNSNHFRLIEKAIEYTETPLEEREEETKYRIKMPKEFNAGGLYVLKQECIENYFFKSCHFENAQSIFTQKEIEAMPFDTSFFIKEEVK